MKAELVKAQDYGIDEAQAKELLGSLPQLLKERDMLVPFFNEIIKMDLSNPETWKCAREHRLLIQKNRTQGLVPLRKSKKEFFLRGGQFVDASINPEIDENLRMEGILMEIEKHEEIERQKEIKRLNDLRISETEAYKEFIPFGINLGEMQEEDYNKLLQGAKMQFEAEQERLRKEEEERLRIAKINRLHSERKESLLDVWQFVELKQANFGEMSDEDFNQIKVNAEAAKQDHEEEQERIKKENERLEKERIAREKEIEAERKKQADMLAKQKAESDRLAKIEIEKAEKLRKEQEAILEKERQEKAELKAKLEAKAEAERKAKEEEKARIEAELNKSDATKVKDLIADITFLKTKYSFKSAKNQKMYADVCTLIDKVINHIEK